MITSVISIKIILEFKIYRYDKSCISLNDQIITRINL